MGTLEVNDAMEGLPSSIKEKVNKSAEDGSVLEFRVKVKGIRSTTLAFKII